MLVSYGLENWCPFWCPFGLPNLLNRYRTRSWNWRQGRPGLNFAGTSAGTRLWKLTKPYSSNWLGLEAGSESDTQLPISRWRRAAGLIHKEGTPFSGVPQPIRQMISM